MDETRPADWKPPYFAFQTFWTFMADLAAKPLPPKIDRSLLKSKSGTDQANLLFALRAFNLVDSENNVEGPNLAPIAQGDEETRAKALGDLVRLYYPRALALSEQSGTEGQLHDQFREEFGFTSTETRRKAVTFFLHAARKAGIDLSQHFPTTRSGSGGPGAPRPRRTPATRRKPDSGADQTARVTTQQTATGEVKTVSFGDAGTVTVSFEVKWLDLSDAAFTGLRRVMRDIETLGDGKPLPDASKANEEAP